jgi:hypothetical protein
VSAGRQAGDVEGFCECFGSAVEIPGRSGVGRERSFHLFGVVDIEVNLSDLGRGRGKEDEHLARLVAVRKKDGV